jgi:hypothetical protein
MRANKSKSLLSFWAMVLAVAFAGCGASDPFDYVPVQGTVTYDDGSQIPAARLRLTFVPQAKPIDAKTNPLPGKVDCQPDGSFDKVTSHKFGDGVVPGVHKVLVIALDEKDRPTDAVGPEYSNPSTTPLSVDTAKLPWPIIVKKP